MSVARATALVLALTLTLGAPAPAPAAGPPAGRSPEDPSTEENRSFLWAAVPDLLGRESTPADHERWQEPLDQGRSRATVAREMTRTGAHARLHVTRLFQRILDRAPDPAGRDHWAGRVVAGLSTASLASRLYASAELSPLGAGREAAFVDRMYQVALGRAADPAGRAHWIARLRRGEHRTVMARQFFLAPESNQLRVRGHYIELLRRPPTPAESTAWTAWLRAGDDLDLVATLVASPEYFRLAGRAFPLFSLTPAVSLATHQIASGNGPSGDPAVSGDGRWVVFSSTATDLVPGDGNGHADVFLADLLTHRLRRLTDGDGDSTEPDISPDGTAVAFASTATDLVAGHTGSGADIFLLDLASGAVTQITRGNGPSGEPSLDRDASQVAFSSAADDLVAGDVDGERNVFVATTGPAPTVTLVPPDGDVRESRAPHLSAGGGTVVFDVVTTVPDGDGAAIRVDAVLVPLSPAGPPVRMSAGTEMAPYPWLGTDESGPSGGDGPTVDATGATALYGDHVYGVAGASAHRIETGGVAIGSSALADDGIRVVLDLFSSPAPGRASRFLLVLNRASGNVARSCDGVNPDISAHGGIVVAEAGGIVVCR